MEIDDTIENGVFAISLVSEPAIEELFVYLSKQPQLIKLAEVDTADWNVLIYAKAI